MSVVYSFVAGEFPERIHAFSLGVSSAASEEFVRLVSSLLCFFSSRRRHTRLQGDWSSDVCSSDLTANSLMMAAASALAGVLYGAGGATAYAAMAALAAAGGGFALMSMRFMRTTSAPKSGERRVGEEGRSRGGPYHLKKKHIRHDDR